MTALVDAAADAELRTFISARRQEADVPGMAVGWYKDGRIRTHCEGVTSLSTPHPVCTETLFQIGSIGKTMTTTLIMHLAERGALSLDAPVIEYLPDLELSDPDVTARVTVRHLVTHTGGWAGDHYRQTGRGDDALRVILGDLKSLPQQTDLGKVWSYNNAGFYIAGAIIEKLLQSTYEQAIYDVLCQPLGLECYFFAHEIITKDFAVGHAHSRKGIQVTTPWEMPRSSNPLGGMVMNIGGLLKYGLFHIADAETSGTPVSVSGIRQMREFQIDAGNGFDGQGLGWQLKVIDGVTIATHAGSANGQPSLLALVPERSFAIAILANADTAASAERAIVKFALATQYGLEKPKLTPDDRFTIPSGEWAGRYSNLESTFTLQEISGQPTMTVHTHHEWLDDLDPPSEDSGPVTLGFYGPDRLVGLDGGYAGRTAEFLRDSKGAIQWFRIQSRAAVRH